MLDERLCRRAQDNFSGPYDPQEAVTNVSHINPDHHDLTVIFPPWHGGNLIISALKWRLSSRSSVLNYEFHDRILEPDMESVPNSFNVIARRAAEDLYRLQDEFNYRRIHLIGLSLGNVALAKTAALFENFDSASLVTSASALSDSMWDGARTQHIRQALEEQDISRKDLRTAWHDLAPASHAHAFKDKPVDVHISRNDRIIPSTYQLEMLGWLKVAHSNTRENFYKHGHVATLSRFCIKG